MSSSQKLGKRQPQEQEDNTGSGPSLRTYTFEFEVPKTKHRLAYEVLKRWWYCMPAWPPATDYTKILAAKGLKEGTSRTSGVVRAVPGYDGLFFDHQGEIMDFRDKTNCPSFDNLKTKDTPELAKMLVKALQNQIKDLKEDPARVKPKEGRPPKQNDLDLERELESFLVKVQKAYQKMLG